MGLWNMLRCEPSLEELLADEMMGAVTRSAGTDRDALRAMLHALALRLPEERFDSSAARARFSFAESCDKPARRLSGANADALAAEGRPRV
jgi:hypothetical protein